MKSVLKKLVCWVLSFLMLLAIAGCEKKPVYDTSPEFNAETDYQILIYRLMNTIGFEFLNASGSLPRRIDIVNITLHFFLKDVRPMQPLVTKHNTAVV